MFPPFLIQILISLIVIAVLLWVVQMIPIDANIKQIIRVIVIVFVVIWVLYMLMGMSVPGANYPWRR